MDIKDLDLYNLNIIKIDKNIDSTDGNVYNIYTNNNKYIAKVYNDLNHVLNMINIHECLINNNFYIPSIIKTIDNNNYIELNNKIIVLYSYLEGTKISNLDYSDELVIKIAKEVRRLHTINNKFNLDEYITDNNNLRLSLIHFDLTKDNIFYKDRIGFIDFDDAKYGESLYDVAILISFLFISKKRGYMRDYIKLFIDTYYANDIDLKMKEVPKIKEYALKWLNDLVSNNNFNSSLKESFLNKIKLIKENEIYE